MINIVENIDPLTYQCSPEYKYWNDESIEKDKVFYVDEKNTESEYSKAIEYVNELGLIGDLSKMLEYIPQGGRGISLASGTCCDADIIISSCKPIQMDFLDYSKHRIHAIAPIMLRKMGLELSTDINLIHGDYYNVKCMDGNYDFVVMSMALMMSDEPYRLMEEVHRILKHDGYCIIVGEHRFGLGWYVKNALTWYKKQLYSFVNEKKKIERFSKSGVIRADISGARFFTLGFLKKLFCKSGFRIKRIGRTNREYWSFLLWKN